VVTVLILEDEPALRSGLERHLTRRGHSVVACGAVHEAIAALEKSLPDVVLTDLWLPDGNGLDALRSVTDPARRPPTIVMTGEATVDTAVAAARLRVHDYLLKPFSMEALDTAIARIGAVTQAAPAPAVVGSTAAWRDQYAPEMVGESPALHTVFSVLSRVTTSDCSILVQGETGTGKELVARAIHASSGRGAKPFVAVNCAAVPENLMESELFGHSKGAYTGADKRVGRFMAADGGTLFLDEIGEMPLALQSKLLRALQEKQITPLGENKTIDVDVRVVAATHRDLDELVTEGLFREDLLYRLDVIRVELPPLRQRPKDVKRLVERLLGEINARRKTQVTGIDPAVMETLEGYAWPGNVRQLLNVLERAVLLRSQGNLELGDLPTRILDKAAASAPAATGAFAVPTLPEDGVDLREAVERFEDALIEQALQRTEGNKNRAAGLLRLSRSTLVEKLRKRGWGGLEARNRDD